MVNYILTLRRITGISLLFLMTFFLISSLAFSQESEICKNLEVFKTTEGFEKCQQWHAQELEILNHENKVLKFLVKQKYQEAQLAKYDYNIADMNHTIAIYNWQLKASEKVLGLIVFLVISGVILTGYQLYMSFKLGQSIDGQEITANAKELSIKASIVGVIVLIISLVFTYMFLTEVYKIVE